MESCSWASVWFMHSPATGGPLFSYMPGARGVCGWVYVGNEVEGREGDLRWEGKSACEENRGWYERLNSYESIVKSMFENMFKSMWKEKKSYEKAIYWNIPPNQKLFFFLPKNVERGNPGGGEVGQTGVVWPWKSCLFVLVNKRWEDFLAWLPGLKPHCYLHKILYSVVRTMYWQTLRERCRWSLEKHNVSFHLPCFCGVTSSENGSHTCTMFLCQETKCRFYWVCSHLWGPFTMSSLLWDLCFSSLQHMNCLHFVARCITCF